MQMAMFVMLFLKTLNIFVTKRLVSSYIIGEYINRLD